MLNYFKIILIFSFVHIFYIAKAQNKTIDANNFHLCGDGKTFPYYYPNLDYKGGFYAIKKHFYNNYKKVSIKKTEGTSGIVRIRFAVNCKAETGNYSIEMYDYNYKPVELDSAIINQLLKLTQELNDWIPAKNDKGETVNSHKFFAFKILNGELIDILPK